MHLIAFLPRRGFGDCDLCQFPDQTLEDAASNFRVRHLATAEKDGRLDLVPVGEKALDVLLLEVVIVLIHLWTKLDLFDLDHALVLLRLAGALLLLILVLAEVHDSADRRDRSGGDLDQIEPLLLGDGQRGGRWHDPELLTGLVDHADFSNTDALVGANAVVTSGRTIESDTSSSAYGLRLTA